ncbi:MAG: hypothetical protein V1723_04660 [Candidatus Uhrbacteria bacterium]
MELNVKARELGTRLAQSVIPLELKEAVLDILPVLAEDDLDRLLSAFRFEEGELVRFEATLRDFVAEKKHDWAALEEVEQSLADEAIADAIADISAQVVDRHVHQGA